MNKYIAEFIGTFFLITTIGLVVIEPGAGSLAPLAIGSVLMVMIYAGGHICGAHFNPAVTIAVWLRKRCDTKDVAPYIIAQLAAAGAASSVVHFLKDMSTVVTVTNRAPAPVMIAEFLFTFALVYVILNVATSKNTKGNSNYGLAIGFTVLAGAFAAGPISGGAFNPAVAVGLCLMKIHSFQDIWMYLVADFGGGIVAALTFLFLNQDDK